MKESKKETKKEEKKEEKKAQVKITKANGSVIYRDTYEGLAKQYESKGCKVEEV